MNVYCVDNLYVYVYYHTTGRQAQFIKKKQENDNSYDMFEKSGHY